MTSGLTALLTATTVLVAGLCWPWLRPADELDPLQSTIHEPLRQPITLDVSGEPLGEVIAELSRQTGVRIVVDDEVRLNRLWVYAPLQDISLAAALEELLAVHALGFIEEPDGVRIGALESRAGFVGRFYSTAPPSFFASREEELLELITTVIPSYYWERTRSSSFSPSCVDR